MAGPTTDRSGQIQKSEKKESRRDQMEQHLARMLPAIAEVAPKHMNPERMLRINTTALRTTPGLADCTLASFLGAVLSAAQVGLEPNTPMQHAWLIPRFRNVKDPASGRRVRIREANLQIGYQGIVELALRSPRVLGIHAYVVREGDDFSYELGLRPDLHHVPKAGLDAPMTHAYAVCRIKDGDPIFEVLTREQVMMRRAAAQTDMVWSAHEEAMWRKSAVHALAKWIPKSNELATVVALETAQDVSSIAEGLDDGVRDALLHRGIDPESIDDVEPEEDGPTATEPPGADVERDPAEDPSR